MQERQQDQELTYLRMRVRELELKLLHGQPECNHSREWLKILYSHCPLPYQALDLNGIILAVNQAWLEVLGYTDQQVVGHGIGEFLTEDSRVLLKRQLAQFQCHDQVRGLQHEMIRSDRHTVLMECAGQLGYDSKGHVQQIHCILNDVTERHAIQVALAESEAKYRAVVDNANIGIVIVQDGQRVFYNPKMFDLLECNQQEYESRNFLDGVHPDDLAECQYRIRRSLNGEQNDQDSMEIRIITRTGNTRWIESHSTVIQWEGKPALLVFLHDNTQRRKVQDALKNSEEKFSKAFDYSPNIMALVEKDTRTILDVNQAYIHQLGYRREDIINKPGELGHTVIDPCRFEAALKIIKKKNRLAGFETKMKTVKGSERDVLVFAEPVSISGQSLHILTVVDITKLKQAEAEQKKAASKLMEYQVRLRTLGTELTLTEERERRRMATVLHDGACQSLAICNMKLKTLHAKLQPQYFEEAEEVSHALEQVIHDLRALTFDLSPPTLYILGLEPAIDELLDQQLRSKGIEVNFQAAKGYLPLPIDRRVLLYQSVRELVINIVKHAHANQVHVSLLQEGSLVRITLYDNGRGFDTGKVKSAISNTGGFGLFNIAERLRSIGGDMQIESAPDQGSTFTLTAPFVPIKK